MAELYLHEHNDFPELLQVIENETGILSGLVEKDYWIMHCLYGLKKQGYDFQLKGGTSLSKGFGIIRRFSEDIDLHINPPKELGINENPNNSKAKNIERKKDYYDQLAREINIHGIISIERDITFDDQRKYNTKTQVRHPQTNGICERLHRTMQEEFYAVTFRKKLYDSIDDLQNDLDAWIEYYNNERPHSGRYCFGKTPMQTFIESLPLAKEKLLNDLHTAA